MQHAKLSRFVVDNETDKVKVKDVVRKVEVKGVVRKENEFLGRLLI